jgi:hypothetical protein
MIIWRTGCALLVGTLLALLVLVASVETTQQPAVEIMPVTEMVVSGGYTIAGSVAEFPPCTGAMRGVMVRLLPPGRTTSTDLYSGNFAFDGVPDGAYVLSIEPPCNPFGCWPQVPVTVRGGDVGVQICPEPRITPTPVP